MRASLFFALLCSTAAVAQSNPELEKANRLLFDQNFAAAAKALEAASRVQGNGRTAVLRIYELQGVVHGTLGEATKAREAFQALLSLDPKREFSGKYNAKVQSALRAAKEWANTKPPLDFKAAKAGLDNQGKVIQLATKLKNDAMRLARKVRFHLRVDEARWVEQDSDLQGAYAAANTEGFSVEWWAELLGENTRVLAVVGGESNPMREGKEPDKAPVVSDVPEKEVNGKVAQTPVEPPARADLKKPEVKVEVLQEEPAAPSSGPLRRLGAVLAGAGAVTIGVGVVFGTLSNGARAQVSSAATNANNQVTGLTQKEAVALESQAQSQATVANVLFGVGGALAVTGVICWIVGGRSVDSTSVSISPAVGGVVVSGGF